MYRVLSTFRIGDYSVLEIDRPIEEKMYRYYRINGTIYPIVPVYDLPRSIAVKANKDFTGELVECIQ